MVINLLASVSKNHLQSVSIASNYTAFCFFNPRCVIQHRVMRAQCGGQLGQRAKTRHLAEMAHCFDHAGSSPSQDQCAALPTLDPARRITHTTEQVLDQVGRGQHAGKSLGQPQAHHGKSFLQPLAQGARGAGMFGFQPAREILAKALLTRQPRDQPARVILLKTSAKCGH
jgi:hypothetical protein